MSDREQAPRGDDPGAAFAGARLHIVTGKGGTGKTTAATALALALASRGGRVLLVEVEGRQGVAALLGSAPLPYEEREMLTAPGGGSVRVLAADPESALLEYLELFYGLRRAGQALTRTGAVDFATGIAPGLRDVLLTGKATEAVRRRAGGRGRSSTPAPGAPFRYDAVVMDAPPTGRIGRFLNVGSEVAGLARVGPVRDHADRVTEVLRSAWTRVHFVTLLEEMPAQETRDGIDELRGLGLRPGAVLVNLATPARLDAATVTSAATGDLDTAPIAAGLKAAGLRPELLEAHEELAADLAAEVRAHAVRQLLEERVRRDLAELGAPIVELPWMEGGVDLDALGALARSLIDQGVER
ncbi:ArsA-related P-loop ATPase [Nocardiopsis sp. NPDC006938]|uniref:ArsA-related P-loop ATPase n=1 Tax=Nocardiopsis sp. NPDC006938 TaxID=3364337 RepID=UPI0036942B7E